MCLHVTLPEPRSSCKNFELQGFCTILAGVHVLLNVMSIYDGDISGHAMEESNSSPYRERVHCYL